MRDGGDCDRFRGLLPGLAGEDDGPVDPDAARHLLSCPDCAREARELRGVLAGLAALTREEAPDPGDSYWEGFLPSVRQRIAATAARRKPRAAAGRTWRVAAAAVLLLAAAGASLMLSPSLERRDHGSLDAALARLTPEEADALLGTDPVPEIGAREVLETMGEVAPPSRAAGGWLDDEVGRLLEGLDEREAGMLRAQLVAERG